MIKIEKMKKKAAVFAAAAVLAAAVTGCTLGSPAPTEAVAEIASKEKTAGASAGETEKAPAADTTAAAAGENTGSSEEKELRKMDVVLDWYPNALHTFIYTAIERGYYEDEGLEVNIRFPANDNDALALVAAGKAEIGLYYEHDVIQAVANQGIGIKSIGAVVQSPLNVILSLKEKNITSPEDLVGKTIGYAGTVLSEGLVYTMMEYVGADISDVQMINVGFELMSSMTTGNVDATIGCLVNHEVPQMENEGFEVNWFMVNDYGIPNYYEGVFLANNEMIEKEPEVLSAFLRASAKGFADFQADPNGCLKILMDNQSAENFPLTQEVEEMSCQTLLPLMETEDAKFLSQTRENWQANIDWMLERGLIEKPVAVDDVMVELEY